MATNDRTIAEILRARMELDRYVSAADRNLGVMWSTAWTEIAEEFEAAASELAQMADRGDWPSRGQVLRAQRAQNALKATVEAMRDLTGRAGATMTANLGDILDSAERFTRTVALTQLPTGVDVAWSRVDPRALDSIVNRTTRRIHSLTRPLTAEAEARMKSVLIRGVAVGENPRTAARQIVARCEREFNGGLARARNIARTELLDAHRDAATKTRLANADTLKGWRWLCEFSARTCPSCLAQHGSVHPLEEPGPQDHQQGRCTAVPLTKTWRELGIDLDEPPSTYPDARKWFNSQPAAVQRHIMGPERLKQMQSGRIGWDNLSTRIETPGWRPSYRVTPLDATTGPLTPLDMQAKLQAAIGDRGIVRGITNDMDPERVAEFVSVMENLAKKYPDVPMGLTVTKQAMTQAGLVSAKAVALRIGDEYHIAGMEISPRLLAKGAKDATFDAAVKNGWFVGGADNLTHSITHEFGHILDFYTGRKLSVTRAQKRAWSAAGIKPGSDVDLYLRRHMSGYARTDRDEAIAEAFADVEVNGDKASPVNREIYADLMRLLAKKRKAS